MNTFNKFWGVVTPAETQAKIDEQGHVIFGGRLGHYRYYDMHQVIGVALQCVRNELD